MHLSVSGVPKSAVVCLHDDIENFREGFIFSAEEMHELGSEDKMAAFYQYRQEPVLFPDDYYDKYNYSVCLMPIDYTLSYAALVKGIFKDCDKFDFYNITSSDVVAAKESIVKYGFDAVIYGKKAYEICDMMLDTALNNLNDGDRKYIAPLEAIIRERKTLKERN